MKRSSLLFTFICLALFILLAGYGAGPASIAQNHYIGAPGGTGTTCGNCHGSPGNFGIITADIKVYNTGTTTLATSYVGGTTYDIAVEILHPIGNPSRYGFQLVSFDSGGNQAGSFMNPMPGASIISLPSGTEVVEHSSFITSPIFTVQWVAPNTTTGVISFYSGGVAANGNGSNAGDGGSASPTILNLNPGAAVPQLTVSLTAIMEGPYNQVSGSMDPTLLQQSLFPISGQPYNVAPWNYMGTEGNGWTPSDYPVDAIDWVLISLRTGEDASTTAKQVAGLLMADGSVSATIQFPNGNPATEYYVVLEHRNHLPVMSTAPVQVANNEVTYDFTLADSYSAGGGFGQKNIGSIWLMYGANEDQVNLGGHEITGSDIIIWFVENGNFGLYSASDFNMDGDINADDRILFSMNNGIFSSVPK